MGKTDNENGGDEPPVIGCTEHRIPLASRRSNQAELIVVRHDVEEELRTDRILAIERHTNQWQTKILQIESA
jgi:hypothetical protein